MNPNLKGPTHFAQRVHIGKLMLTKNCCKMCKFFLESFAHDELPYSNLQHFSHKYLNFCVLDLHSNMVSTLGHASGYPVKVSLYCQLCIHEFFWFIVEYAFAGYQSHSNLQICIAVMHIKLNM
jgi:hypothetical protein